MAFLVGGLGLYGFFNYLYNGARIRISLKLLLKTTGASRPPLSGGGDIFGKEPFYVINSLLIKLGLLDIPPYSLHLEFCPGVYLGGNCYTAFRSCLYDFGCAGLVLCLMRFSVLINGFYYACFRWAKKAIFVSSLT